MGASGPLSDEHRRRISVSTAQSWVDPESKARRLRAQAIGHARKYAATHPEDRGFLRAVTRALREVAQ